MAGYLLLVFLMYSLLPLKTQALPPPTLSVNPAVITEIDSVGLNCRLPSSHSGTECYFRFMRGQNALKLPCQQTLTGSELLRITHQRSPFETKVTCFYLYGVQSPESETFSLMIQVLFPPKLVVTPSVITDTDSITLNCQTPSFISVSQCHFLFIRRQTPMMSPCLQTLTGTELLRMSSQSSPAQVKLTCFYLWGSQSPQSETSSIIVRTSLPPTLTVNPPEIDETDSVTLNCRPPSSASVSQCHFYTSGGGSGEALSCVQTLTGTELLRMSRQSSPAQVKLTCFYTEKLGEEYFPSPHSAVSSISVNSLKPTLSRSQLDDRFIVFTCSLPASASRGTKCNLYFGEASRPAETKDISNTGSQKTKGSFCQFFFIVDELLSQLRSVQQRDASCDYTLGSGPNLLSPRSDQYNLTDIVEKETRTTQITSPPTTTTAGLRPVDPPAATSPKNTQGPTVIPPTITSGGTITSLQTSAEPTSGEEVVVPDGKNSTASENSLKTASKKWIWTLVAGTAGCGVTVGVVWLVSAVLCKKRRTGTTKRGLKNHQMDDSCYYSTIKDPATTALKDMTYSTVQAHYNT